MRTTQLNHNIHRHALLAITASSKIIGEVGADAETWCESGVQGGTAVLDAALDVEGVGEDDGFGGGDVLGVVEGAHGFDEFEGVARVLACAGEDGGVGCWWWRGMGGCVCDSFGLYGSAGV